MQNKFSIVFGLLFLYIVNLAVVGFVLLVYSKIFKRKQYDGKIFSSSSYLAIALLVLILLSWLIFSFNAFAFAGLSFLLLAGGSFAMLYWFRKFEKVDSIVLAIILALVLNPYWFNVISGAMSG